jgi:hypothetical protein
MPGPFGPENCLIQQVADRIGQPLPPDVVIKAQMSVGLSEEDQRKVTFEIGTQTLSPNPNETCQFSLQMTRLRAQFTSPDTITQDSPCLGCGRRVKTESPPSTPQP